MKKLVVLLVVLLISVVAQGATVVLKGGKRLQVDSYATKGNLLTVRWADGRAESYPLSAVDMAATNSANATPEPAPTAKPASGPKSPFAAAMAEAGASGLVVTDQDVAHIQSTEGSEAEGGKEGQTGPRGRVVLLSYQKNQAGENLWDITAVVANQGDAPVQPITAIIAAVDDQGRSVGTTSGSVSEKLEPGQQGTLTARLSATGPITSLSFDLSWQSIVPVAKPAGTPVPGQPQPATTRPAQVPPTPAPVAPTTVVNPMDAKLLTNAPPPPAQIAR